MVNLAGENAAGSRELNSGADRGPNGIRLDRWHLAPGGDEPLTPTTVVLVGEADGVDPPGVRESQLGEQASHGTYHGWLCLYFAL
jgi:hypothetical protein